MRYTDLDLMGVVVQWCSGLLLLLLFYRLGSFGASRVVLRTWIAAWAAQVLSISGFVAESVAALTHSVLPFPQLFRALELLYLPCRLLFGGLVAVGALRAVGRMLSARTEQLVAAIAILTGIGLTVVAIPMLTGSVQEAVTAAVFFGGGIAVLRRRRYADGRRSYFLSTAMFLFGVVTAAYQLAYYFDWAGTAIGPAVNGAAATSGYGDALVLALLGAAIVIQVIDDAFRAADQARNDRMLDLASSEARLHGIIDAAREAIMTIDDQGVITLANATAEARFALPKRGALGRSLAELVRIDRPLLDQIRRALSLSPDRIRPTATLTGEGRRTDGSLFPLEFTVGPFDGDAPAGSVVVLRDLTAHHAAEVEREQFERRMAESEKMLAIGRVVSGVAHELNNPLAVVLGQSEQLVDAEMDDEVRGGLQLINEQAHRARHIVKDLLMFVRHRAEPSEPVDVAAIIQRMVASQRSAARSRGISLVTQVASGVRPVLADRNGVEQVLVNLVDNAFDAAGEGGKVRITLRAAPEGAEIAVEDSGAGVPDDLVDRIFEPFFTTKPIGHGTGLGLPVSLGVTERNGGTLRLENRPAPGVGARFVMLLPFSPGAITAATSAPPVARTVTLPRPPVQADGSPALVMLIDDEAAVRSTLSRIFRRGGWNVREAATGEDGLSYLLDAGEAALPSVILCDLKMPGMGGRDVYRHLQERRPELIQRLIFVTGDIVETSAAAFIGSTDTLVVEKPFTVSEIAAAVELVLQKRKGPPEDGPSDPAPATTITPT